MKYKIFILEKLKLRMKDEIPNLILEKLKLGMKDEMSKPHIEHDIYR